MTYIHYMRAMIQVLMNLQLRMKPCQLVCFLFNFMQDYVVAILSQIYMRQVSSAVRQLETSVSF